MKTIAKNTILACLLLVQAGAFAQTYTAATSKVALHHNGVVTLYNDLGGTNQAYEKAVNNDTIYLPGGNFSGAEIKKRITIIGAGYRPDSVAATGATNITSRISIYESAAGGSLIGVNTCEIVFAFVYQNLPNGTYTIKRCRIGDFENRFPGFNWIMEENIIGLMYLGCWWANVATYTFSKNIIFYNKFGDFWKIGNYNNNIIYIDDTIPDFQYSTFNNNIFVCNASSLNLCRAQSCAFQNNLFCSTTGPLSVSNWSINNNMNMGNYEGYKTDSVFVNANHFIDNSVAAYSCQASSSASYVYTSNYHLKSSLPATVIGNDSTDVGIYGTLVPFKDGSLPFNPHISSKFLSTGLDPNGNLKVNIKVTSQDK